MKASYITFVAPFLAALLAPAVLASPVESYPGCQAANDAAKIGDETALKNAIAACKLEIGPLPPLFGDPPIGSDS